MSKIKNPDRPLKEKVSISLDADVVENISKLAEADGRNFSQYINKVLKEHIQAKET